jgi:transcriptional regulator with XRE-family HTH domain
MPMAPQPKRKKAGRRHRATPDRLAQEFGVRLRRLRHEADFTYDAFVEETGLGRGYVSELERGLAVPTLGTLAKIARALQLPIADLVLGDSVRERLYEVTRSLGPADLASVFACAEEAARKAAQRRAESDE